MKQKCRKKTREQKGFGQSKQKQFPVPANGAVMQVTVVAVASVVVAISVYCLRLSNNNVTKGIANRKFISAGNITISINVNTIKITVNVQPAFDASSSSMSSGNNNK